MNERDLKKDCELINGSNLAYLGDAYYELFIRKYLLSLGITKGIELRKESIKYVSAHSHQLIWNLLKNEVTEKELLIFKRGRNNAPHNHRKNLDQSEYTTSSGFEALIGYLYISENFERLEYIMEHAIKIVNGDIQ